MKLEHVDRLILIVRERSHAIMHLKVFKDMHKEGVKDIIIGFENPNAIRMESFNVPFTDEVMESIKKGLLQKIENIEEEMRKLGVEV